MSAKHQVDDIRKARKAATTRLSGHALRSEGAGFLCGDAGVWVRSPWNDGQGVCSCGAASEHLYSNNARKAWHRQHKLDVLAGGAR